MQIPILLALLLAGLAPGSPAPAAGPSFPLDVTLSVYETAGVDRSAEPVTSGVPLPRAAAVTDPAQLRLVDAAGQPVAAQFTPLARWGGAPNDPDQPIKWLLADFQADVSAGLTTTYRLQIAPAPSPSPGIVVTETASALSVDTGAARFRLSKSGFGLFEQIYLGGDEALLVAPGRIAATSAGMTYTADNAPLDEMVLELTGPLHTVVRARGHLRSDGGHDLLAYTARLHFYAGQPSARVLFGAWNDNPIVNDGNGQPDIKAFGSPNTVLFDDLSLRLQLAAGEPLTYTLAGGPGETWTGPLATTASLYQDSSGGPQWDHLPDNAANTFRGFEARAGAIQLHAPCAEADNEATCRSQGWAAVHGAGASIAVGVRHFWQNYPKALDLDADGTVSVGLFPGRYSQDSELRVGEQKTHEVVFYFGADEVAAHVTALLDPLRAWAPASYYLSDARVLDRAVVRRPDAFADFEDYVDATILFPDMNVFVLRNGAVGANWVYAPRPEAWGWRNFGDTIAEDETGGDTYPVFTNQQYDHPWVAILQTIRALDSGGGRLDLWWRLAESGARHQADVDVIHSLCTGLPYDAMLACMDAGQGPPYPTGWAMGGRLTNQHHAWPAPDLHRHALIDYWSGGLRGLLYYYYLTGDGVAHDAWLELAENARWRVENSPCDPDCGPGYAHNNPGEGDARGPAYGLEILTDAYAATGDERYLLAAQTIVAESHPNQTWFGQPGYFPDPAVSPDGRQVSPWGLSLLMKSLGRYLDMTVEWTGAPDAGARDSLLRYADLQASWWRLGEDEPACYYIYENGGCVQDFWNLGLADGLAWALHYDDGRADRPLWEAVAADVWAKSESQPWGSEYAKGYFLSAKTHMLLGNQGVAWMDYVLDDPGDDPAGQLTYLPLLLRE